MSRVITSPVKRWPGTVTLADPLNYEQLAAWQDAVSEAERIKAALQAPLGTTLIVGDIVGYPQIAQVFLPGVCACVEAWDIGGTGWPAVVGPGTIPATPRAPAARLLSWLIGEISNTISEADDIPND